MLVHKLWMVISQYYTSALNTVVGYFFKEYIFCFIGICKVSHKTVKLTFVNIIPALFFKIFGAKCLFLIDTDLSASSPVSCLLVKTP